jgi:hypothetical protein
MQEEVRKGLFADVDGEEFPEKGGAGGEDVEGSGAEAGMAVEEEKEGGHALREGEGGWVVGFVGGEGAGVEGLGEEGGLAESEGEAFTGDGVDGARGVTDECDVAAGDAAEAAGEGEAAAFGGGGFSGCEFFAQEGDRVDDFGEVDAGVAGHGGDANFLGAGGGDVDLAPGAPVDFYVGGSWLEASGSDAVVGAEAEAAAAEVGGVEAGPGADAGGGSIGSDEPAVGNGFAGEGGGLVLPENDWGVPGEADAQFFGAVEEEAVESGAANTDAPAGWEFSGDGRLARGEEDAGEFGTVVGLEMDTELSEGLAGVGHEAFAAGFVDGRAAGVSKKDVGSALAQGDGGGEACGSCSGDAYVTDVVTHYSPQRAQRKQRKTVRFVETALMFPLLGRTRYGGFEAADEGMGAAHCIRIGFLLWGEPGWALRFWWRGWVCGCGLRL